MKCTSPFYMKPEGYEIPIQVPCGNCLACKASRAKQWTNRLLHEYQYHEKAVFVTLTYDNENLPEDLSLDKRHFQLFMKLLRKNYYDKTKKRLKYFACGEYGDKYDRPHYHAIIFDLGIEDESFIHQSWRRGMIKIGSVTEASCRYVSNYVQKKLYGDLKEVYYGGRQEPFQLQSRGLGLQFVLDNAERLQNDLTYTYHGKTQPLPRYYRKKLGLDRFAYESIIIEKQKAELKYAQEKLGCENLVDYYDVLKKQCQLKAMENKKKLENMKKSF